MVTSILQEIAIIHSFQWFFRDTHNQPPPSRTFWYAIHAFRRQYGGDVRGVVRRISEGSPLIRIIIQTLYWWWYGEEEGAYKSDKRSRQTW